VVEYTGRFLSGKKFDSSRLTENPFSFIIGANQVIDGWEEGVQLMKIGGTSRFIIPSRLAYGSSGNNSIPGNAVLDFDIELISFEASSFSTGN
jgi:FKBP-type peptidyl-prolyl cis-trans isomerase